MNNFVIIMHGFGRIKEMPDTHNLLTDSGIMTKSHALKNHI